MRRRAGGGFIDRAAFTLIEILIVLAIVGIIGAVGVAGFIDWRANARLGEIAELVERQVADARGEAKRRGLEYTLSFEEGQSAFDVEGMDRGGTVMQSRTVALPPGATLAADVEVTFDAVFARLDPYQPRFVVVTSGAGVFERTGTIAILPPVGVMAVSR